MRRKGKTYLNIYDLKKEKNAAVLIDRDPEAQVTYLDWASAGRLILKRNSLGLFGIDADGENVDMLLKWASEIGFDPTVLDILEHDPEHLLVRVAVPRVAGKIPHRSVFKVSNDRFTDSTSATEILNWCTRIWPDCTGGLPTRTANYERPSPTATARCA